MGPFARVAVLRPVRSTYHYTVSERLRPWVRTGVRCLVPFGSSRVPGFVVELDDEAPHRRLKSVAEILDPEPPLPPDLLSLGLWLSRYYHHPPGETLATLLPPSIGCAAEPIYRLSRIGAPGQATGDAEGVLWRRLRERGELSVSSLGASEISALDRLVEAGLAERDWRVRPSRREPLGGWISLSPAAPPPERLPERFVRQIGLLRALSGGEMPVSAVLERGVSRETLSRAVSRGWVVRAAMEPVGGAITPIQAPGFGDDGANVTRLTTSQEAALEEVVSGIDAGGFRVYLLQGVTGSGKTEVYLRAAEEARRRGLGVMVLVPEISLTPQLLGRFSRRFGSELAVLHSALGEGERRRQWERVRRGTAPIAVGARSAVFAPIPRLGLVVIDEEHDPSYKQDEGLRYHAKHVALIRARETGGTVLLGSATPDLETRWAATTGRYRRLVLPRRVLGAAPPKVRIVDLRQEEARTRRRVVLSGPLKTAVQAALGRGEQALLFLNRRGFSPALSCPACGAAVSCSRCSIALTLHRRQGGARLLCHYCNATRTPPEVCPDCGAAGLFPAGIGTQRLVEAAAQAWPGARVARLDRDTARRSGGTEVLASFHRGEADILVGTQMVAKGHHFPRLTVVGVVDADLSLTFPDFRAAERTFQVLTQVAGRAGREERPGLVFLQTRNPHHGVFGSVAAGDYERFADAELATRRDAGFPPFRRVALLRVSSPSCAEARRFAEELAVAARDLGAREQIEVIGPAPAPLERVRGRYRFQVLLKAPGPESRRLQDLLRRLLPRTETFPGRDVRVHADVDPVSML